MIHSTLMLHNIKQITFQARQGDTNPNIKWINIRLEHADGKYSELWAYSATDNPIPVFGDRP